MKLSTIKTKYTVLGMSILRGAIYSFSQTFLNIYLISETKDNTLVLLSLLFGYTVNYVLCLIIMRFLNERNAKIIYILSFMLLFAYTISLPLTRGLSPIAMTFIVQALANSSKQLYYGTTEMVIMGANDDNSMRGYAASISIMEALPTIIVPFISGVAISVFSYNTVFIILIISALLLFLLSRGIETFCLEDHKYDFKEFLKTVKDYHVNPLLAAQSIKTVSMHNMITEFLIPYMILLRTGSEISVGSYASIISLLAIVALVFYKRLKRKPHIVVIAIVILICAIPMLYSPSVVSVVIFYAAVKIIGRWIDVEGNSIMYAVPARHDLQPYKREYRVYFNTFIYIGRVVSILTTLVLFLNISNATAYVIAILIFESLLIPAMIVMRKYQEN